MFWQSTMELSINLWSVCEQPCYPTSHHHQGQTPHSAPFIWTSSCSIHGRTLYLLSLAKLQPLNAIGRCCALLRENVINVVLNTRKWCAKLAFKVGAWCRREPFAHLEREKHGVLHSDLAGFFTLKLCSACEPQTNWISRWQYLLKNWMQVADLVWSFGTL